MLPIFDCRQDARGVIAVGQFATGFIAIGQVATGVIAVGQLARGVFVVGQLAVGVFTVGMLTAGAGKALGLLALGGRARGLLKVSLIPQRARTNLPPTVPLAAIMSGAVANGWVHLRMLRLPDRSWVWRLPRGDGGQDIPVELDSPSVIHGGADFPGGEVLAMLEPVRRVEPGAETLFREAPAVGTHLVAKAVQPLPTWIEVSPLAWALRLVVLAAVCVGVWFAALAPLGVLLAVK